MAGETRQLVLDVHTGLGGQISQLDAVVRAQAGVLKQIDARLGDLAGQVRVASDSSAAQLDAVVRDQATLLERIDARLEDLAGHVRMASDSRAAQHAQLLEVLRFIHSRGQWRRGRLRELRADPSYERPFMDADPLVSVVIPTYDNHRLLRGRAISSVLAQTHQNFEVVVVGDAAAEEARVAVESFDDPRISFSNLPYRGPYPEDPQTRWLVAGVPPTNEAVWLARGLWIAPLADDDAFRPHHIERLLAHARSERLELAYGRICQHLPDERAATSLGRFPPEHAQFGLQSALYHCGVAGIFELELADASLGLPCDWGMCVRMMEAGVRIGMLDEATVDYYPSRHWTPRWEE